ncbi:MAG: hypothetical protein J1F60_08530 [Oscillospiraceae bacterium]|nr:hypothetical protein [Oscillospiraceae bacterium]
MKQKQGEKEAKSILQSKGFEFDDTYYDDNSKNSMPDLRFVNGRYLEVTHTLHNHNICSPNNYCRKSIEEQLQIANDAEKALDRITARKYPRTSDELTDGGMTQFESDKITVKNHFGVDVSDFTKHSEFNCDIPIVESSTDNIIREIGEKASKHSKGDTDLFIFILEDEYNCLCDLLETKNWNGCYNSFMNSVIKSPFDVVYLCVWNFESQTYNTENPILLKFETSSEQKLIYSRL